MMDSSRVLIAKHFGFTLCCEGCLAAQVGPYQNWNYAWTKNASVRKALYLRAGYLDVIFLLAFSMNFQKNIGFAGVWSEDQGDQIASWSLDGLVFDKLVYLGQLLLNSPM